MEGLGLDMMLDIDPPDAPWQGELAQRREVLLQDENAAVEEERREMSEMARTRHVLEAHNMLRSMNRKNDETFGYVCETLEEDLLRHSAQEEEEE